MQQAMLPLHVAGIKKTTHITLEIFGVKEGLLVIFAPLKNDLQWPPEQTYFKAPITLM
jgi:hypothetical protein